MKFGDYVCESCGTGFVRRRKAQRFCKSSCRYDHHNQRREKEKELFKIWLKEREKDANNKRNTVGKIQGKANRKKATA